MTTVTGWITIISVLLAVLALRASQRQRLRQFETLYVQRYWSLMDGLTLAALRNSPLAAVATDDEKIVWAYLRLCEDQLELRAAGWISNATWRLWSDGMHAQLQRWPFDTIWHRSCKNDSNNFRLLQAHQKGPGTDPCRIRWWRRWLIGIAGRGSV
jgi:hypothetical protein